MERKSVNVEAGFTQAERVKELDRSREFESATVTLSLMPSKDNALPIFPAVQTGRPTKAPLFPFPEESAAVVPFPSSNFQWATRPDSTGAGLTVFANHALASELGSKFFLKAFALT